MLYPYHVIFHSKIVKNLSLFFGQCTRVAKHQNFIYIYMFKVQVLPNIKIKHIFILYDIHKFSNMTQSKFQIINFNHSIQYKLRIYNISITRFNMQGNFFQSSFSIFFLLLRSPSHFPSPALNS